MGQSTSNSPVKRSSNRAGTQKVMTKSFFSISFILISCSMISGARAATQPDAGKVWADGTRYIGGLISGKQNGKGRIVWDDGTQFLGTFKNGLREGAGKLILPDESTYVAVFKNDVVVLGSARQESPSAPIPISAKYISEMNEQFELEMRGRVESWTEAWSSQNLSAYFSHYSTDFKPTDGSYITAWKQDRSSIIARPGSIDIAVKDFDFEVLGTRDVTVAFEQSYRSSSYSDVIRKQLNLHLEEDGWKIVRELVLN